MSLEFAGEHAPINHQYFQTVDMLIHHFGWNMKELNPFDKPHEPTTVVGEVKENKEAQQKDARTRISAKEKEYGLALPYEYANKRNTYDSETGMPVSCKNNNMHNAFEDNEEEEDDEMKECENEDKDNSKGDAVKDGKIKATFDLEDMSLDDAEGIICKLNELHPEEGLCGGLFKYADDIRTKSEEKEKERCKMVNIQNCITLINYANVNEVKPQKQLNKHLIEECNNLIEEFNEKYLKDNEIQEEELEPVKSFAEHKCKIEEENNRIIR